MATDFMPTLATKLKGVFAKITHIHTSYENHINATGNPHSTSKADLGLGNVNNYAQVRKNASSIDGNVAIWSGTSGDLLGSGYTVDSTLSSLNTAIPTSSAVKTYVDNGLTGVSASGLKNPVADITSLKALNTTSAATYPDKVMICVESLGLYRLDRDSSDTGDDKFVVAPTTGVGRWVLMSPSTASHELLSNIQGGKTGEHYHIDAATAGALVGSAGTPSGTNKFVTASDAKLAYINSDGTFQVNQIAVTSDEWTAFVNALNS